MGRIGTLAEWSRFLDARTPEEAQAELARYADRIDAIYAEISALVLPMWQSPTAEVAQVLMVARTAMTDAVQMLQEVRGRYDDQGPGAA